MRVMSMMNLRDKDVEVRNLPNNVDYYIIRDDGSVVEGFNMEADVYIDELDTVYLGDPEIMKYVRKAYGGRLGVMHELSYDIQSSECHTPKILLGVLTKKT